MSNLNDLTKEELITYINERFGYIESIIGDIPVSEQVNIALNNTASKQRIVDLANELNALKNKIEIIIDLVGDTPVSEQISNAINNEN